MSLYSNIATFIKYEKPKQISVGIEEGKSISEVRENAFVAVGGQQYCI